MFPKAILEHVDNATTKFTPSIANGLAVEHLQYVEEYVDRVFWLTAAGFPPGLEYRGCRKCTPLEEYEEITKKKGSRCVYDVARSDVYLMEYKFRYNGVDLPSRFMYLPFVTKAGTIYIGGSRFVISPILADQVISIQLSSIFVRLLKAKLTFNRVPQHYIANDSREGIQVAYSDIYNKKASSNAPRPTVNAKCTLVHYLLCKYGFSEMFRRFGGCDPVVGGDDINSDNYPDCEWVICRSTTIPPRGFGKGFYEPCTVRIAIPRHLYTPTVKNLVAGFFYVVDHFPSRVKADYVNSTRLWMILLGHLIWSGNVSEGRLYGDVEAHIASLDEYIDALVSDRLKTIGYECPDIYELFYLIIDKFSEWLLSSDDRASTMYNKELSILPFICYEITSAINTLYFKLKAAQKKELTEKKIANTMSLILKKGLIFKITKEHGEVTTTSTSGDNMALKITNLLVPQGSSSRNSKKKDRAAITDPGKRLHASIAEVGQAFALPKSEPTGRSRVSLCVRLNETGLVMRDPRFVELLDQVQNKIRR